MADPPEHPLLIISLWDLHPETWCAHEYIQRRDYRNAVREASERLVERAGEIAYAEGEIRLASRAGAGLIDGMFLMAQNGPPPLFAFNALNNRISRTEHRGLTDLARGIVNGARNPLSHRDPRTIRPLSAFEWLAASSLLHEHLDDVTYLGSAQPPEAAGA